MDFLESNDFTGGMNSDAENRTIPKGDYRADASAIRNGLSDVSSEGTATNSMGNLQGPPPICPYNGGVQDGGISHVISNYEDNVYNSVIYMVWNANGKHSIMRYYPNLNGQEVTYQVIQYNFQWQPDERITSIELIPGVSGQLLYWCDSQGLHNINLDRACVVNKQKSWKLYFVSEIIGQPFFNLNLADFNGAGILAYGLNTQSYTTLPTLLNAITADINANHSSIITATTCDCYIEITETATNGWSLTCPTGLVVIVPDNWYGNTLGDILFARAVAPSLFPPKLTYQQDPKTAFNNVKNHVFQGALQFYFSDYQESVLGVASQIPIDNLQCDGTNNPLYNYIDINFNNPDFIANLALWLTVIDRVGIIVREHNTGNWKTVEILKPCDFLDYANGAFLCHYKFYNDIQATDLDATVSGNLDSGVPILADSEATIYGRLIDGGITQGRDAPECVQASAQVHIGATASQVFYTVRIYIRILTYGVSGQESANNGNPRGFGQFFPNFKTSPFWQAGSAATNYSMQRGGIFQTTKNPPNIPQFPFWGGGSFAPGGNFAITQKMETSYNQLTATGAFCVVSVGTPFQAYSTQLDIGLPTTNGANTLDVSTNNEQQAIGNYLKASGTTGNDLYSYVDIRVTEGVHTFRVVNPWVSPGDQLQYGFPYNSSAGLEYQKTSANVWGVYKPGSGIQPMFTANSFVESREITINVTGDVADGGTFLLYDVSPPCDFIDGSDQWQPINCYLMDSLGDSDMNGSQYNGFSVEKTVVSYLSDATMPGGVIESWTEAAVTDHNGYFFGINAELGGVIEFNAWQVGAPAGITQIVTNYSLIFEGFYTDFINKTLKSTSTLPIDNFPADGLVFGFITTGTPSARANCSTFVNGKVVDQNGTPISGVTVLLENGSYAITDLNGNYSIVAWGDMLTPNAPFFDSSQIPISPISANNRIVDSLTFTIGLACVATYPNGQIIGPILITPFGSGGYNPNNPFIEPNFVIDETVIVTNKSQKRGGKKLYGLRFYDIAGRVCSVVLGFELYIPYETEDLSQFAYVINSQTGQPYAALTILGGQPVITWFLNGSPPQEAAYYQWMWTLDGIYANELQWVANSVQYVSAFANPVAGAPAIDTSYQNGNYVGALISVSNIANYLQANPDSIINYSYTPGDRIRLISDRNNVLLNTPPYSYTQGIYDYEITGTDSSGNLIVKLPLLPFPIQSGFTIEIYSPATLEASDIQTFYEVGEVYKCTNPGQSNNAYSVTSAQFTSGDTYWRGRVIQVDDALTDFTGTYPVIIEAPNVSDFYQSQDSDINPSRTGTIDPNLKQIYYPDRLIVSDQFQEGSAYNGLSFCLPTNISDLGANLGNVARLLVIGKSLKAIMRNNAVSNNVGVVSMRIAQETGGIEALSDDFLNTPSSYQSRENFGTDLPAAVVSFDGYIYMPFSLRNSVGRHADDGTIEISRNEIALYTPGTPNSEIKTRMVNYFKQLFQNGNIWDAVGIFDKRYKDYILTVWSKVSDNSTFFEFGIPAPGIPASYGFNVTDAQNYFVGQVVKAQFTDIVTNLVTTVQGIVTIIGGNTIWIQFPSGTYNLRPNGATVGSPATLYYRGQGTTVSWNETKKRWPTTWPYVPECYGSLGDNVYAFLNGYLWKQDTNPIYNNWFGVQYPSQITIVFNDKPEFVKTWNAMSLMQVQVDGNNNWSAPIIQNDRGQLSRFLQGAWRKLEEFWYAAFKRDLNTVSVTNPIINGLPLKSSSLVITLSNNATVNFKIYKAGYNASFSPRTEK